MHKELPCAWHMPTLGNESAYSLSQLDIVIVAERDTKKIQESLAICLTKGFPDRVS